MVVADAAAPARPGTEIYVPPGHRILGKDRFQVHTVLCLDLPLGTQLAELVENRLESVREL
jgi:hypothetical protein